MCPSICCIRLSRQKRAENQDTIVSKKEILLRGLAMKQKQIGMITLLLLFSSGCVVGGYSSGGGWFIWPGGIGLLLVVVVLFFLLRRR